MVTYDIFMTIRDTMTYDCTYNVNKSTNECTKVVKEGVVLKDGEKALLKMLSNSVGCEKK